VNLFDAGATSLSAARLHTRLCADFGRALPITDVFRYPTVASMAAALAPDDASNASNGHVRTAEWVSRNNRRREALRARPGRTERRVSREGEDTDQ
jgi:hypothetical protein